MRNFMPIGILFLEWNERAPKWSGEYKGIYPKCPFAVGCKVRPFRQEARVHQACSAPQEAPSEPNNVADRDAGPLVVSSFASGYLRNENNLENIE